MTMRPGTDTGSLINHLHSRAVRGQPDPVVGMGATLLGWTDRNAGTIVSVEKLSGDRFRVGVARDRATLTSGSIQSERQTYAYETVPDACPEFFQQDKRGFWKAVYRNRETGRWVQTGGGGLRIGERETYRDPSF